jgi:PPM family protein phosphatase
LTKDYKSHFKAFGLSHTGRVRQGNEDAFLCDDAAGVFVVCDGMGGAAAGEVASHLAAQNLASSLAGGPLSEARMVEAVAAANRAVFQKANSDRRLEGMGTTLVTLALNGQHAWIAHVGDSRCYVWRESQLERLTMDHSLVEEQIRLGQITRSQAERSPFQHVITRAIGTTAEAIPDVRRVELHAGDVFLLMSDGLTRELSDEAIATALGRATTEQEAAEALVHGANSAGGRDNITCVLVRIESSGMEPGGD